MVSKFPLNPSSSSLSSVASSISTTSSSPPHSSSSFPRGRAFHLISTSSISHNFSHIRLRAASQKCQVMAVIKADAYGHGACATALHLATRCGCDAFAVATLEEAVDLRISLRASLATEYHSAAAANTVVKNTKSGNIGSTETVLAATPYVRILVLGPPVNFPECFDTYYYYNIEMMVTGIEVAEALLVWLKDIEGRRQRFFEMRSREVRSELLRSTDDQNAEAAITKKNEQQQQQQQHQRQANNNHNYGNRVHTPVREGTPPIPALPSFDPSPPDLSVPTSKLRRNDDVSATVGGYTGSELAREVRKILVANAAEKNRKNEAVQALQSGSTNGIGNGKVNSGGINTEGDGIDRLQQTTYTWTGKISPSFHDEVMSEESACSFVTPLVPFAKGGPQVVFQGLADVARLSRMRAEREAKQRKNERKEKVDFSLEPIRKLPKIVGNGGANNRIRWHAMVDSGMGRVGFRPDDEEISIDMIQRLVDAEIFHDGGGGTPNVTFSAEEIISSSMASVAVAVGTTSTNIATPSSTIHMFSSPIEFYGMCTHMAEAVDGSDYTKQQMSKFVKLLSAVRKAGIHVPTVHTDNSSALLSESLTHFDPAILLSQKGADTLGYVRCGGGIYGQRPAFPQLRASSTLMASVHHVATVKAGDSVGYDRKYVAASNKRIATITIGFADGYPRELGNGVGRVSIRGSIFHVAGNVCMDMLMVDLRDVDDPIGRTVVVGDMAVLWGPEDIVAAAATSQEEDREEGKMKEGKRKDGLVRLQDLAGTMGTTQSALTCGLNLSRVQRRLI